MEVNSQGIFCASLLLNTGGFVERVSMTYSIMRRPCDILLVNAGHLCDLSILFIRIQNLVTIFVILCESRNIILMT